MGLQRGGHMGRKKGEETKLQMVQGKTQRETGWQHRKSWSGVRRQEAIKGAQAQANAAKAHADALGVQLSYARILSPINGIVADRPANAGEMVAAGMGFDFHCGFNVHGNIAAASSSCLGSRAS